MEKIPNLISTFRLLLSPLVYILHQEGRTLEALGLFLLLALSDGVDGFVARRFRVETVLGKYLDPVADKALIFFGMLAVIVEENPLLFLVVLLRDALLISGSMLLRRSGFVPEPLLSGKIATFLLFLTVTMGFVSAENILLEMIFGLAQILSLVFVALSGVQYVFRAVTFLRLQPEKSQ